MQVDSTSTRRPATAASSATTRTTASPRAASASVTGVLDTMERVGTSSSLPPSPAMPTAAARGVDDRDWSAARATAHVAQARRKSDDELARAIREAAGRVTDGAAFVRAVEGDMTRLGRAMQSNVVTATDAHKRIVRSVLGAAEELAPEQRRGLLDAFARAVPPFAVVTPSDYKTTLSTTGDAVRAALDGGAAPAAALALADALRAASSSVARSVDDAVLHELRDLQASAAIARDDVAKANQQLGADLLALGPAFTEDQKKAYIDQFRRDHACYDADARNTDELADFVAASGGALDRLARNTDGAATIYDAVRTIAASPRSGEAMAWAKRIALDPDAVAALHKLGVGARIEQEVFAPALERAMSSSQDDPHASLARARGLFEDDAALAKLVTSPADFTRRVGEMRGNFARIDGALGTGDVGAFRELWSCVPADAKGIEQAFVVGATAVGAVALRDQPDFAETLKGAVGASKAMFTVGTKAMDLLGKNGRVLVGEVGVRAAGELGKVFQGAGLVASAISFGAQVHKIFQSGSNAADWLSAVGGFVSLVGDIPGPWSNIAKPVAFVVSNVLNLIAGFVRRDLDGDALARRMAAAKALGASGKPLTHTDARRLIDVGNDRWSALAALGVTNAAAVQRMFVAQPLAFSVIEKQPEAVDRLRNTVFDGQGIDAATLEAMLRLGASADNPALAYGLREIVALGPRERARELFDALAAGGTDGEALRTLAMSLYGWSTALRVGKPTLQQHLAARAAAGDRMARNLLDYVVAHQR